MDHDVETLVELYVRLKNEELTVQALFRAQAVQLAVIRLSSGSHRKPLILNEIQKSTP